jgi:mannose-6-phosphate isomerase-like protein (cupin superfamily)
MFTRVRAADLISGSGRTARFEGKDHDSGISFYLVDNDPGQGPGLHRHPYTETWVVRTGTATVIADGDTIEVVAGDIVTVTAGTAHKFTNSGSGRLEMVCIHASPRMIQEELE